MSDFRVYITVPEYLAQYIRHTFGHPVELPKDSPEGRILNELTVRRPKDKPEDTGEGANVEIVIPYFKGKDPQYFNYLHDTGKKALEESFRTLLVKELVQEVSSLINFNVKRQTLIYAFMEKRGISEEHWYTLSQIYHRSKKRYMKECGVKLR